MVTRRLIGAAVIAGVAVLAFSVPAAAGGDARGKGGGLAFVTFEASLSGATEVPGPGDADGVGVAEVNLSKAGAVCFGIAVEGISLPATAAHIHAGASGVAGPVVVTLEPPEPFGSGSAGASTGCVTNVSRSLLRDIASHPDQFYVNVHTADFPAGAVRGQLSAA